MSAAHSISKDGIISNIQLYRGKLTMFVSTLVRDYKGSYPKGNVWYDDLQ